MNNPNELKAYVKKHPDNKMGWYLLGKEYERSGQAGKANYCFNRSGEVFEAFERKQVPADVLLDYQNKLEEMAKEKARKHTRYRKMLVACILLLLMLVPSSYAPGLARFLSETALTAESGSTRPNDTEVAVPAGTTSGGKGGAGAGLDMPAEAFTAINSAKGKDGARIISLLKRQGSLPEQTIVLGMREDSGWLLWDRQLKPAVTLTKAGEGRTEVQSYDPEQCSCEPPTPSVSTAKAAAWSVGQEELAVLSSAMMAYRTKHGKLPESVSEMMGDFPNNLLYGVTPAMETAFKPIYRQLAAREQQPGVAVQPDGDALLHPTLAATLDAQPFFDEPLRIVVDKSKHRLAVVSGDVLIRNYRVGLGGDKTPEGTFFISDKVVNPNGKSNGEFGSRGMQLSDTNYAIHGTNEPNSIEKDESLGCIRMTKADVEELFALVPAGTSVEILQGAGLPDEVRAPEIRYTSKPMGDQTNPRKVYHWLH